MKTSTPVSTIGMVYRVRHTRIAPTRGRRFCSHHFTDTLIIKLTAGDAEAMEDRHAIFEKWQHPRLSVDSKDWLA